MSDNNLRDEMAQIDQKLFGENPEPVEAPQPAEAVQQPQAIQTEGDSSLSDLFAAAGLQAPATAQPQPAPIPQPAEELAGGEEPSQQDIMQAYMAQQQELNQQLAVQQQQYQQALYAQQQQAYQPEQPALPNMNDPRELSEMMTSVGLDPTSATDVYMFRSDMERRQMQNQYQDQIAQMQQYINHMHSQQVQAQSEATLGPQIDATLAVYGEIPSEVATSIKHQAATILSENLNNATEAQAIQWAMEPYLPLLKMVKGAAPAQAPVAQQPSAAKPNANAQAVLAAALSGGSSGHGPSVEDMSIEDFERALFRNN